MSAATSVWDMEQGGQSQRVARCPSHGLDETSSELSGIVDEYVASTEEASTDGRDDDNWNPCRWERMTMMNREEKMEDEEHGVGSKLSRLHSSPIVPRRPKNDDFAEELTHDGPFCPGSHYSSSFMLMNSEDHFSLKLPASSRQLTPSDDSKKLPASPRQLTSSARASTLVQNQSDRAKGRGGKRSILPIDRVNRVRQISDFANGKSFDGNQTPQSPKRKSHEQDMMTRIQSNHERQSEKLNPSSNGNLALEGNIELDVEPDEVLDAFEDDEPRPGAYQVGPNNHTFVRLQPVDDVATHPSSNFVRADSPDLLRSTSILPEQPGVHHAQPKDDEAKSSCRCIYLWALVALSIALLGTAAALGVQKLQRKGGGSEVSSDARCQIDQRVYSECMSNTSHSKIQRFPSCLVPRYHQYREVIQSHFDSAFDQPIDSCAPSNLAVVALASLPHLVSTRDELSNRYVLNALYFATNGPSWGSSNTNWVSEASVCHEWIGISCYGTPQVQSIDLGDTIELNGTIPSELGLLNSLRKYFHGPRFWDSA